MTGYDLLWFSPILIAFGFVVIGLLMGDHLPPPIIGIVDWCAAGFGAWVLVAPVSVLVAVFTRSMPAAVIAALVAMHFGGKIVSRSVGNDIQRRAERAKKYREDEARRRNSPE